VGTRAGLEALEKKIGIRNPAVQPVDRLYTNRAIKSRLLFYSEDGDSRFLRNIDIYLLDYQPSHQETVVFIFTRV
jgi:hypothetical protein